MRWEYGFSGTKISAWLEALPLKLKPAIAKMPLHFRNVLKNVLDLLADAPGVFQRGPGRRLHRDDEISLVFVGHEALGHALENQVGKAQSCEEQHRRDQPEAQEEAQGPPVPFGDAVDDFVHLPEEPVLFAMLAAQQDGRQRRREGQRVEGGNRNRECDGQRELAKQNAGRAGKERHRHKHRHQHQRGGDDRSRHFSHGERMPPCGSRVSPS